MKKVSTIRKIFHLVQQYGKAKMGRNLFRVTLRHGLSAVHSALFPTSSILREATSSNNEQPGMLSVLE